MSKDKIFEDICIAFVKYDKFKYTYSEFKDFYEKIKIKEKEQKKIEKNNNKKFHKNTELTNYRNFITYHRNKGFDIKTTLELWNEHINKLKNKF